MGQCADKNFSLIVLLLLKKWGHSFNELAPDGLAGISWVGDEFNVFAGTPTRAPVNQGDDVPPYGWED